MVPTVTYTGMLVAWDMGARSFVPPAMVVISSIVLVLTGSNPVAVMPNFMFAALLVSIGINMIWDNLRSAWNMLPVREFSLVILHIILTALLGMLWAVVLGVLFTATIFIVEYSAHSGVLLCTTLLLERSKVQRSSSETEILEQYGATVLIVHLHGMIFFGSASSVLEEIKAHVLQLAELQLPLQVLLMMAMIMMAMIMMAMIMIAYDCPYRYRSCCSTLTGARASTRPPWPCSSTRAAKSRTPGSSLRARARRCSRCSSRARPASSSTSPRSTSLSSSARTAY
jgi:hypothetical protein